MAERKSARQRAAPKRPAAKRARETASTPPSRSQVQDAAPAAGVPANPRPFIVGIGASAGGLEALSELLEHLPADSGMVFVVVTHEDPDRVSPLPMLLQRHTDMRVSAISDGMQIAPNQVYVAPPVGQLALFNGAFHLMDHTQRHGTRLPIDYFFRALAEAQEEKAIGIVLSGTASDGTLGLLAIKNKGGLAMAQSVASAKFTGMPRSAIDTGRVDMVLAPREMPAQLLAYASNRPFRQTAAPMADENPALAEVLPKIFLLLRHHTGHDFSSYKTSTIQRRIARRMHVHQIETPAQYLRFLQETPHELDILFQEFLISVTQFFRDPEAFDVLARSILPQYLETHPAGMPIRVWVPGCATGEEAYSLGIVLYEAMEQASRHDPVQIFGTDLDARAIAMARQGRYPVGIAADMSPERLARFFTHEDATYQVRKPIRDIVVFATQNLLKDPPFTKLDVLSCRNVLIYLTNAMQHRLLPLFHYALQPGGVLFLGSSETVSGSTDLFSVADKQWKIFRRQDTPPTYNIVSELASVERNRSLQMAIPPYLHESHGDTAIGAQIEKYLLAVYGPVSVVISDAGDVVYVHGRTGMYLEPAPGLQNRNVLEMAREGLRQELAFALQQARLQNEPVIRDPIQVKTNGDTTQVRLTVRRIIDPEPIRGLFLVTFEATAAATAASVPAPTSPRQRRRTRLADLEQELAYTQTHLQNTVEELEAANEELRASNEEAQSTNEELQSANEELESSREELQSLNEELHTVNAELHDKVEALSQANDDIQNLLNSINVATLILDVDLRIKRFTTQMTRVVNLIDADIGRPLSDLASTLNYDRLLADAREVLRTLVFKETEVQTKENTWYLLQIMPYRTLGNSIDGLVLTFVDISKLKATEQIAADLQYANTIVQTVREPLLVLDAELRVVSANQAFYRTFHLQVEQVEQRHLYELSQGQWNIPALRQLLQSVLFEDTTFVDFEVRHTFADVGYKRLLLNARRLQTAADQPGLILLAMEDATDATA